MDDVKLISGVRSLRSSVILHSHTIGPLALARIIIHPGAKEITAHITPTSLIESIRFGEALTRILGGYMRFAYNRADRIIAVSEATAAELFALKVRRPIAISYNAIDERPIQALLSKRSSLRKIFGWQDQTVVIAVGQLQPRKGVLEFIECAAALPDLHFLWIGGMPFGFLSAQRRRVLQSCSTAPENVTFLGAMPRADVFRYYAAADIFFLPSRHETFGLATLEAATAGLPLILCDLECYRNGSPRLSGFGC
jgi:1,2-diacylglycerol-3-alpha-glucose alpha-1,2-galactosyltransferase